jgi:hypothetical protein
MGTQMQTKMLPALAGQLGMDGDQLNAFLGENFPSTAQALATLPEVLGRFDGLVGNFENNLDNYETLKPVNFSNIIWTLFLGGLVTLAAFAAAWWAGRGEEAFARMTRLEPKTAKEDIKV